MQVNRLNKRERIAYAMLEELEQIWPDTLWLYSASGSLYVVKKLHGEHVMLDNGGVDGERIVGEEIFIENDGGDW